MSVYKNKITIDEIKKLNKYFRAANYLSVGQLYLLNNPLLKRKLVISDLKPKVVGHWGTVPGQNFIYTHLNRIIKKYDLNMFYVSGPGHGGNAMIANDYLDGSYTEIYSDITQDESGMQKLFKQFSFPGGVSSHVAPETPGSINEGGELGYSLAHSFGAVLDNPDLIVACVVGDGEAETGPLATSWNGIKFLNHKSDGVVLPILHLNGYKIANPTIMGRMSDIELEQYFSSLGYNPIFVEGSDTTSMHRKMAIAMDKVVDEISKLKNNKTQKYPMIILRSPKGWTGPKRFDGKVIENSFMAHQIPIPVAEKNVNLIYEWLNSYHPEELFDSNGKLIEELKELLPTDDKRMGMNKHTNGGLLLKELITPNIDDYELKIERGNTLSSDMTNLGAYVRDVLKLNQNNFRIFGPDEALSNRLNKVFEVSKRMWNIKVFSNDELMSPNGKIMDAMLSEHMCEGMLEGYLLTGRYGFFHSYEAFIRIIDSMTSQHAKWLKVTGELPWRKPIASLNYVLTSHCWQQDHNGFTHQDPGFLNHVITKKADNIRMYLPIDTNTLISCFDHIIKTKNYINVIIASKHDRSQWLTMKEAKKHCEKGIGIFDWASCQGKPNIILACSGDTPTLETLAAVKILNSLHPKLKVRVVNVIDLFKLQSNTIHPHGLNDLEYNELFPSEVPVIFAFHGYPNLIHELTYKRDNHENIHVKGYIEEGTITTPFDMRVQNKIDRFNLVIISLKYIEIENKEETIKWCLEKLNIHHDFIREYGKDMDEVVNWKWSN